MRTRKGLSYPKLISATATTTVHGRKHGGDKFSISYRKLRSYQNYSSFKIEELETPRRKKAKISPGNSAGDGTNFFEVLPDDIVISILAKLSSSASSPADFITLMRTCKRFNGLAVNPVVLSKASPKTFGIKPENWCESAHKFLKICSDSGNVEASYTLGMIRFYCLESRGSGASLMAKAAINSHAQALYSLSVIQFNGSGGTKTDKDLRAGVALCARAAFLGHVDALRELGHCLQDGYGVRQNVAEGRRFLIQANARELATCLASSTSPPPWLTSSSSCTPNVIEMGCPLLSDFGCNVPEMESHLANRFLTGWFSGRVIGSGLRACSNRGCGRVETRKHEYRRCSVCGKVNYCSRACQAMDWKVRHKAECSPLEFGAVDGDGEIHIMEVDGVES